MRIQSTIEEALAEANHLRSENQERGGKFSKRMRIIIDGNVKEFQMSGKSYRHHLMLKASGTCILYVCTAVCERDGRHIIEFHCSRS